ncbi:MAG: hypothetical protein K5776_10230 [Lachnospiraceae bacterium]|nr:hypothetical protein [Lachnospiraceae bacterium]
MENSEIGNSPETLTENNLSTETVENTVTAEAQETVKEEVTETGTPTGEGSFSGAQETVSNAQEPANDAPVNEADEPGGNPAEPSVNEPPKPLTRKEKKAIKKAERKEKKLQKKIAKKERKKRWKETKKEDRRKLKEHYKDAPWFIRIPRLLAAPLLRLALLFSVIAVGIGIIAGIIYLSITLYYVDLVDRMNDPVDPERIEEYSPRDKEGAERIAAYEGVDPDDTWTICVYMIGADLEDDGENDLSLTTIYETYKEKEARNEASLERSFTMLDKYSDELKEKNLPLPEFLYYPYKPIAYTEYLTNEVVVATSDGCASTDIAEMFSTEMSDNIQIVVQTGGATRWSNTFINPNKTQRFLIKNDTFEEISNEPLQRSTDPETLANFLRYCDKNYKSDHKMLILWDHGSGPFGYGSDSIFEGEPMSLKDIREALSSVYTPNQDDPEFDIIGFDACLMSNLEVTHALSGFASFYALSEDSEPGDGWDYTGFLTSMTEDPTLSPAAVAQAIADSYSDYYMTQNVNIGEQLFTREVTFAVLDAKKAEELYEAYGELTKRQLIDSASDISVLAEIGRCCDKSTHVAADSYNIINLVDLGNYVDYMVDTYPEECTKIDNLLKETVLYRRQNGSLCDSEGISVYIPGSIDSYYGLSYFLDYEYDICENDYTRALYYYKMSGCMNDEMLDTLKTLTDKTPTILDISLFNKFEKIDPVIEETSFSVPIEENLQNMVQRYSFDLAEYNDITGEITYYGEDEYAYPDGEGKICCDFGGEWVHLDGQPLSIEFTSASSSAVEYRSRVLYNDTEAYLVFSYNRDSEEFAIKGIREIPNDQEDGINFLVNSKANKELQPQDRITPLYQITDAYGQTSDKQGKTINYKATSKISMKELDSGYYLGMVSIYDQRGDSYASRVLGYTISGGKIKECAVDENFVGTDY